MTVSRRAFLPGSERDYRSKTRTIRRVKANGLVALRMPGAGLNCVTNRKASPERSALKPYWGKPTVRNFRGGYGNGGIIRSPLSAMTLLDREPGDLQRAFGNGRRPVREGT